MAGPLAGDFMQTRYAIRWSRLPEVAALAASAIGLIAVVAGLV